MKTTITRNDGKLAYTFSCEEKAKCLMARQNKGTKKWCYKFTITSQEDT